MPPDARDAKESQQFGDAAPAQPQAPTTSRKTSLMKKQQNATTYEHEHVWNEAMTKKEIVESYKHLLNLEDEGASDITIFRSCRCGIQQRAKLGKWKPYKQGRE